MNPLSDKITAEIGERGAIPFHRFMQLALYCPVYGYYEKEGDTPGGGGDYYTSVSVGRLFGELLAWQFAEWFQQSRGLNVTSQIPAGLRILESGAHRGELARDVLRWLREHRREQFEQAEYWIAEPSARRRQWQMRGLQEFQDKVHWVDALAELQRFEGVLFSNELLDAMPVHRFGWDAHAQDWFEWGVALRGGQFDWTRLPRSRFASTDMMPQVPSELKAVMPDGYSLEVCPDAILWWRQAAEVLAQGKLLTIDYGFGAEEQWLPERTQGTLRAYREHRLIGELLANPGEQDLTAHVDFAALQREGEAAGLRTETFASQEQFLTGIAARIWENHRDFGVWSPQRKRQFQTLTHPQHLGHAFRVLVQGRA